MNKLYKVLSLGLMASVALSSVPAQAGVGNTAKAVADAGKAGANIFVEATTATAKGLSKIAATGYENAHVLRVIAISGLAAMGLYTLGNKLSKSFKRERKASGYTDATLGFMESTGRYASAGALILGTGLAFEFIRRGFSNELDAFNAWEAAQVAAVK